jgi:hypothetical protein
VAATDEQLAVLRDDLVRGGVHVPGGASA